MNLNYRCEIPNIALGEEANVALEQLRREVNNFTGKPRYRVFRRFLDGKLDRGWNWEEAELFLPDWEKVNELLIGRQACVSDICGYNEATEDDLRRLSEGDQKVVLLLAPSGSPILNWDNRMLDCYRVTAMPACDVVVEYVSRLLSRAADAKKGWP